MLRVCGLGFGVWGLGFGVLGSKLPSVRGFGSLVSSLNNKGLGF